MQNQPFEKMLTGGHPNSLGRTLEVVEIVLKDKTKLEELYQCYFSDDEVVRLRTSNALKRVTKEHPEWTVPYLDRLISEISKIDQASTQWTLAQLFMMLEDEMTEKQKKAATKILKRNMKEHDDWVVLNFTMETLTKWSKDNPSLKSWLKPYLEERKKDKRKSVAKRANKFYDELYEN